MRAGAPIGLGLAGLQQSEGEKLDPTNRLIQVVGEAGLEPTTPGLEGRCSIQLSYSPGFCHCTVIG